MCSFDMSKLNDLIIDIKVLFQHNAFFKAFEKCNVLPLSLIKLHLEKEYDDAITAYTKTLLNKFKEKDLNLEVFDENKCSFITYMCSMEALFAHSKNEFFIEYDYLHDAISYCTDATHKKYKSLLQKRLKSLTNILTTHSNKAFFKRCEECAFFFNEREEKIFNLAKRDRDSYKKALDIVRDGLRIAFPSIDYDDFELTLDLNDEDKFKDSRDEELNFLKYDEKGNKSEENKINTVYISLTKLDDIKKVHLYYYFTHLLDDANFDILTFLVGGGLNFFDNYKVIDNFNIEHYEDDCMAYVSFDEKYLKEVKSQYKSLSYTYNHPFITLDVVSNSLSRLNALDSDEAILVTKKLLANSLGEIMTYCIAEINFIEEDTTHKGKKLLAFPEIRDYLDKNHVRCRNGVATYMSIHNLTFSGKNKKYGFRESISFGETRILEFDLAIKNNINIPYEYFYNNGVLAGSLSFDFGEFNLVSRTNDTQEILSEIRHFIRFLLNQSILEIGVSLRHNNFKEYQESAYYLDILSFEEHDLENITNFLRHRHVKRAFFTPFLPKAKPIELINDKTYKNIDTKQSIELIDINDFNDILFTKKGPKALFKNSVLDVDAKNNILLSLKEKDYPRAYSALYNEFNKSYENNNRGMYKDDLFCSLVSGILAMNLKRYMIAFRCVQFFERNYNSFKQNPYILALYLNALFITGKADIANVLLYENFTTLLSEKSPIALKILAISFFVFNDKNRIDDPELYERDLKKCIRSYLLKKEEIKFKERLESMCDASYTSEDFFVLLKDEKLTNTSAEESALYKEYVKNFNLSFDKENFIDLIRMMGFDLSSYRVNAPFCYFKMTVDSHSFYFIFDGNTNAMSHIDIHNEYLTSLLEKIKSGAFNEIKNENGDIAHVCAIIFKFDDFKNPSVIYKKDIYEDSNYFFFNYSIENKALNGPMYYEEKRTLDEIILKLESDESDNNADDIMPKELLNNNYEKPLKKRKESSTSRFYKGKSKEENALSLDLVLLDDYDDKNNDMDNKKEKKALKTHILKIDDINC